MWAKGYGVSAVVVAERSASDNPVVRQQVTLPSVIAIPGGLPIKVGNEVIGGAGASGSPGVERRRSKRQRTKHG